MKLGDCKWLRMVDQFVPGNQVVEATPDFTGHKWCTVQSVDGVLFQVNYTPALDSYQVNTHWYAAKGMASREEYSNTFWIGSTIELAAFLRDKQPT